LPESSKSLVQILGEGRDYMLRCALASLVITVIWHGLRGGIPDFLGLRLVTAAWVVFMVAVLMFGGTQGGVAGLIFSGFSRDNLVKLIRAEIAASEQQRFHPLHAVLGTVPMMALGVWIMLRF
jgi:hypothetical protein